MANTAFHRVLTHLKWYEVKRMFGNAIKEVDLLPQASVWTSALTGNEPLGNNPILSIEPTALLLELVLLVNAFLISSPINRL